MFVRTHPQTYPKFGRGLECPDIVRSSLLSAPAPQQEMGKGEENVKMREKMDKEKENLIWERNLGGVVG